MVRDEIVKLLNCAGAQNVPDTLTKSLPRPALEKHGSLMVGTNEGAFLLGSMLR
jgi:hypothetical protein